MLPKTIPELQAQQKARDIAKLKKRITVHKKYYFVKNENNIRFCYLIPRIGTVHELRPQYVVFIFSEYEQLQLAAHLLQDAGIIDKYDSFKFNDSHFYVKLYQYAYHEHTDAKGITLGCAIKQEVEWCDLKMTKYDAENFLAHFYYNEKDNVRPMFPKYSNKNAA